MKKCIRQLPNKLFDNQSSYICVFSKKYQQRNYETITDVDQSYIRIIIVICEYYEIINKYYSSMKEAEIKKKKMIYIISF